MTYAVLVWHPAVKEGLAPVAAPDFILRLVLDLEQTKVDWKLWNKRTWWTIRAQSGAVSPQVIHHRRVGSTWVSWIRFSGYCHTEVQQVTCLIGLPVGYLGISWQNSVHIKHLFHTLFHLAGYYGDGMNDIIVFSSCYLPQNSQENYQYVMDNLFR